MPRRQVAALCYRTGEDGRRKVLLVTSRGTGRWIVPKGWPIKGLDAAGSAAQEAWEEAGVRPARLGRKAIGSFLYRKRLNGKGSVLCRASVFPIEVGAVRNDFPERAERRRKWVAPAKAAEMVDEPELQELLRQFAQG